MTAMNVCTSILQTDLTLTLGLTLGINSIDRPNPNPRLNHICNRLVTRLVNGFRALNTITGRADIYLFIYLVDLLYVLLGVSRCNAIFIIYIYILLHYILLLVK